MELLSISRSLLTLAAASMLSVAVVAQGYTGVGGRFEQQLTVQQTNLAIAPSGDVNIPSAGNNRRIFVRVLSNATREVSGFDLRMRFGLIGEVVPAWLYTADAQNRPGQAVVDGEIGIGTSMQTCRASLRERYTVQANTFYFLAFQLPAVENVRFETTSGGATSPVTYFVTPSGSPQQAGIRFGINAGGFSPEITLQPPVIGHYYNVDLAKGSVGDPAWLWFTLLQPGPAFSLASAGANGSFLYLGTNILLAGVAPGEPDRTRRLTLFMPNIPGLIGLPIYCQWQVATNTVSTGWVTSDMAFAPIQ